MLDDSTPYKFITPGEIEIEGTRIFIDHGDNDKKYRGSRQSIDFYMAKSSGYLTSYMEINRTLDFKPTSGMNILEVGIFSGGSAVFFDKVYKPKKLVCLDYMPDPAPALERYRSEGNGDRVRTYYGVDQADKVRLLEIAAAEFDGPIDLVIDDASHFYEQSRATFEAIFPLMRTHGIYAVEDWSWAHNEGAEAPDHFWADQPALTNLMFRLIMLHGRSMGYIRRLAASAGIFWVQKGSAPLPRNFTLEPYERIRNVEVPTF